MFEKLSLLSRPSSKKEMLELKLDSPFDTKFVASETNAVLRTYIDYDTGGPRNPLFPGTSLMLSDLLFLPPCQFICSFSESFLNASLLTLFSRLWLLLTGRLLLGLPEFRCMW